MKTILPLAIGLLLAAAFFGWGLRMLAQCLPWSKATKKEGWSISRSIRKGATFLLTGLVLGATMAALMIRAALPGPSSGATEDAALAYCHSHNITGRVTGMEIKKCLINRGAAYRVAIFFAGHPTYLVVRYDPKTDKIVGVEQTR